MALLFSGSATIGLAGNDTMLLHSGWKFRQAGHSEWHPATVPGVVHTDLMDNGLIEDPYYRLNERSLQWIDKEDWIYEVSFDAGALTRGYEHIRLEFLGLDTYADVFLNETQILTADNMFRRWAAEVKPLLKERGNVLRIYFHSPIKRPCRSTNPSLPLRGLERSGGQRGTCREKAQPFHPEGGLSLRLGLGPRLVTSGIWRPVKLQGWNSLRLEDVFHHQHEVSQETARVETQVEIEAAAPVENAVITVSDGKRVLGSRSVQLHVGMNRVSVPFTIDNPKLWWCRGMGEPYLYTFRTAVEQGGRVLAGHSTQVGLRSVTVEKKPDAYGRSLRFLLNGEPVFCKGANYIPCDCFLPRITPETYERTIQDAVDVNMNMLRVWGGGIYEDDYFYELCDRQGILIWQDFMYACAVYPAEGALLENMRMEAIDNVKRLRNHPCVVYWCGNNENQDSWLSGWKYDVDKVDPKYSGIIWKQYEEQYYRMLAKVVAEYAPGMGYQPTSPFSDYGAMSNDHEGDRHYWEVWHAKSPSPSTTASAAVSSANTVSSRSRVSKR
ncbi:MAG: glycoside hydrolase family 2 protein [Alistipes onderdonkii]